MIPKFILGIGVLFLLFLVFLLTSGNPPLTNYPPKNDVIVAFGDSLVAGTGATEGNDFVSKLGVRIGKPIVNLGVPGDTTADGLARVEEVLAYNPGVVILLLGGNDYLRRIDEETTRTNLAKLIQTLQENGSMIVLLGVRSGILISGRDDMYEDLTESYGLVYVEDVLDGIFGKQELMYDGIHPNDAGYTIIADRLLNVFQEYELADIR